MVGLKEFLSINPFARVTPFFILGILLFDILPTTNLLVLLVTGSGVFILLSLFTFKNYLGSTLNTPFYFSTLVGILFFCGYAYNFHLKSSGNQTTDFLTGEMYFLGKITKPAKPGNNFTKLVLEGKKYEPNKKSKPTNGKIKILTFLTNSSKTSNLNVGDLVLIHGKISQIPSNQNPFDFDFKTYYRKKGILYQTFVDSTKWFINKKNTSFNLLNLSEDLRKKYLLKLQTQIDDPTVLGILQSLILGFKGDLKINFKETLKEVGAMHLFAISGLHLGIIYLLITQILKFLKRNLFQFFLRFIITTTLLWTYAMISGFSASVVRAALMLTIFDLGKAFGKKSSGLNSLFVSALILLIFDPNNIYDLGFQLSYLAVLGIFFFYLPLLNFYKGNNWFLTKIWQSFSISISAQSFIVPILLMHFNYLSIISLITNLFSIPIVTIIVSIGLPLTIISTHCNLELTAVYNLIEIITQGMVILFNKIQHLNFLNVRASNYGLENLISYSICLILTYLYFKSKKAILLHLLLFTLIINTAMSIKKEFNRNQLFEVCVYKIPGRFLYEIVNGRENIVITDGQKFPDDLTTKLNNYWVKRGFKNTYFASLSDLKSGKSFEFFGGFIKEHNIYFNSEHILLFIESNQSLKPMQKQNNNYLICSKQNINSALNLIDEKKIKEIIVYNYTKPVRKKAKEVLSNHNIPVFSIPDNGAWKKRFKTSQKNNIFSW